MQPLSAAQRRAAYDAQLKQGSAVAAVAAAASRRVSTLAPVASAATKENAGANRAPSRASTAHTVVKSARQPSPKRGPSLGERLAALEQHVESLNDEVRQRDASIQQVRVSHEQSSTQVDALQRQLRAAEAASSQAADELRTTYQHIATLEQSNQRVAAELHTSQQRAASLERQVAALETVQRDLKRAHADVQAKLAALHSAHAQLVSEHDQLGARCASAESLNVKQAARVADLEQQLKAGELERRRLHEQMQEMRGNIRVIARLKPLGRGERGCDMHVIGRRELVVASSDESVGVAGDKNAAKTHTFAFDRVFDGSATQSACFEEISQAVQSALDGFHVCIFTYGQTGSGKTYTMEGGGAAEGASVGMIARAVALIYERIGSLRALGWQFAVSARFVEIYNESLRDLLARDPNAAAATTLKIVHRTDGVTDVTGAVVEPIRNAADVMACLRKAAERRAVGETQCNEQSSRSHSVFTLNLTGTDESTGRSTLGVIHLVDLAGSERLAVSKAEGARLKETQAINKSLSCLGDVIMALANGQGNGAGHVPYRNSRLTFLLQNALGGHSSKTLMFATLSQREADLSETLSSLRFATKVNACEIGVAKKKMHVQ